MRLAGAMRVAVLGGRVHLRPERGPGHKPLLSGTAAGGEGTPYWSSSEGQHRTAVLALWGIALAGKLAEQVCELVEWVCELVSVLAERVCGLGWLFCAVGWLTQLGIWQG